MVDDWNATADGITAAGDRQLQKIEDKKNVQRNRINMKLFKISDMYKTEKQSSAQGQSPASPSKLSRLNRLRLSRSKILDE